MDGLKVWFTKALPDLTDDRVISVLAELSINGCHTVDDLEFVDCDADLGHVLLPVERRKLASKISSHMKQTTGDRDVHATSMTPLATTTLAIASSSDPRQHSGSSHRLSEWADSYCIPWSKGSALFKNSLESKVRPKKSQLLKFIRAVGDNIMEEIGDNPGSGNLSVIASKIVSKHSVSLADYIEGMGVIGDGSQTFRNRLIRYIENERRKKKAPLRCKLLDDDASDAENNGRDSIPKVKKRKVASTLSKDNYGCSNWQPSDFTQGETEESQELKRSWLVAEFGKPVKNRDMGKVKEIMVETYASQRLFINLGKAPITVVSEKWPFLLVFEELISHFELLMNVSLIAKTDEFLANQASTLFSFSESSGSDVILKLVRKLREASSFNKNDTPKTVGCFLLLPLLLKEDDGVLFKYYDKGAQPAEVEAAAESYPHVAIAGRLPFYQEICCYVLVDGHVIGRMLDFRQGVIMMFAAYFVFNIEYPEGAAATLEYIQRCIAKINLDRGTKASRGKRVKRPAPYNPRVMRLLNNLNEYNGVVQSQ